MEPIHHRTTNCFTVNTLESSLPYRLRPSRTGLLTAVRPASNPVGSRTWRRHLFVLAALAVFFMSSATVMVAGEAVELSIPADGRELFTPSLTAGQWYRLTVGGTVEKHKKTFWGNWYAFKADALYRTDGSGNFRVPETYLQVDGRPATRFLLEAKRWRNSYTFTFKGRGKPIPLRHRGSGGKRELRAVLTECTPLPGGPLGALWLRLRPIKEEPIRALFLFLGGVPPAIVGLILLSLWAHSVVFDCWRAFAWRRALTAQPPLGRIASSRHFHLQQSKPSLLLLPPNPAAERYARRKQRQAHLKAEVERLTRATEDLQNWGDEGFIEAHARKNGAELLKRSQEILERHRQLSKDPEVWAYTRQHDPALFRRMNGPLQALRKAERYVVQGIPSDDSRSAAEKRGQQIAAAFDQDEASLAATLDGGARLHKVLDNHNLPDTKRARWERLIDALTAKHVQGEGEDDESESDLVG